MKKCLYCFMNVRGENDFFSIFSFLNNPYFCSKCLAQLFKIGHDNICERCQNKVVIESNICQDCQYWEREYQTIIKNNAVYQYNTFASDLIWRVKHERDIVLLDGLMKEMRDSLLKNYYLKDVLFIPIPSDIESIKIRRFNLIEYAFEKLPLKVNLLKIFETIGIKRIKHHNLPKSKRIIAAKQTFSMDLNKIDFLTKRNWKEIVLIDDIYTTGSTIVKGIQSLKMKTDTKITSFTIFR